MAALPLFSLPKTLVRPKPCWDHSGSRSATAPPSSLFCDSGNCILVFSHPKETNKAGVLKQPFYFDNKATSQWCSEGNSDVLTKTLHFFHLQIFKTGQVFGMQSKGKEERPPVDAGWQPWGILWWHLCVCHPTAQPRWELTVCMRHRFSVSPAVVLFSISQDWRTSAVHVHSLPVKPSLVEPENAQPELSRRSTRTLAPYERLREEHSATKHSPYSFLIVRPRRNCKGGHTSWMGTTSTIFAVQWDSNLWWLFSLFNTEEWRSFEIQSPELPFNQTWTTVCKTGCTSIAVTQDVLKTQELLCNANAEAEPRPLGKPGICRQHHLKTQDVSRWSQTLAYRSLLCKDMCLTVI